MKGAKTPQNDNTANYDIFDAMDRLSRMIDSDKKHLTATPSGSPEQRSPEQGSPDRKSPEQRYPLRGRNYDPKYNVINTFEEVTSDIPDSLIIAHNIIDQVDTIQNAKRAAQELSELVRKSDEWIKDATFRNKVTSLYTNNACAYVTLLKYRKI